jgi:hypothetical protein
VRAYAEEKRVEAEQALTIGMKEKADEFKKAGLKIYQ